MLSSSRVIKGARFREDAAYLLEVRNVTEEGGDADEERVAGKMRELLDNAGREAGEIVRKARAEAEEIARETRRAGYEEGYRDAFDKAGEEAESLRAEARDVLRQAERIYREKLGSLKDDIISLALDIAEKIVAAQLSLDREMVLNIAAEALRMVSDRERVTLFVHPSEGELFRSRKGDLEKVMTDRAVIQVVADPAVSPGGCLVDTEQGTVDASLDARWKNLLDAVYAQEG